MRDDDDGELPVETLDGIHDGAFSLAIERARGFIEYQDAGLLVQCPGNADPLPLSARQPNAALSNHSQIALGPSLQKVGNLRLTRRVLDAREIYLLPPYAEGDILRRGRIGKIQALRYVSNRLLPGADALTMQGHTVDQNLALGRSEQSHEEIHRGGLAASGRADKADARPSGDSQIQAIEYPGRRAGIAKAYAAESHRGVKAQRRRGRLQHFKWQGLVQ